MWGWILLKSWTTIQSGMRQWSEFKNYMTSVERIVEYTDVKAEAVEDGKYPEPSWPERGEIEFRTVSRRYSEDSPYVLKELNFSVMGKEIFIRNSW